MLSKITKFRVWIMLFILLPFIGQAQLPGLPTGWEFTLNPTSATYAIPTDVMFDNVDALQAGDWVGVFFEDDGVLHCAGAVEWTGTANLALVAFGNDDLEPVKNGFADGELVQWKFYRDATSEEEVVFTDPEFFWTNGDLGSVTSFFDEDGECVQTLSVISGFNWVSFNVLPEGNNINDALVNYDPTDGDIIKNSNSTITYFGGTWFPSNHMLNPDVRYLLQRQNAAPSVFNINGLCVDVTDPIDLVTGWNWIGYKPQTSQLVNDAFAIVPNPTDGDILKSASTTVTYFGGVWYPTNATLDPGVGYLFSLANGPAELIYNQGDGFTEHSKPRNVNPSKVKDAPDWVPVQGLQYNMSIYAQVSVAGTLIESPGSLLAAFKDGECRGVAEIFAGPAGMEWALTPSSDLLTEPGFTMKVWDAGSNMVYDIEETFDFENNAILGQIFAPLQYNAIVSDFGNINGLVTDALTDEPIENAEVTATLITSSDAAPDWVPVQGLQYNMSIYAQVSVAGTLIESPGSLLAAFKDGECRGVAEIFAGPAGMEWALTPSSDLLTEPGFTMKVWDAGSDMVYDIEETFDFENNAILGQIFAPLQYTAEAGTLPLQTTTNALGEYAFEDIDPGFYDISVSHPDYQDGLAENVEVIAGETTTQDFQLNPILPPCEDALISDFPISLDDVCAGEDYTYDFSGVVVENAIDEIWTVAPMEAGTISESIFTLDAGFEGGLVTISLLAVAEEPCEDAYAEVAFEVYSLPEIECPEFDPLCMGDDEIIFDLPGVVYVDGVEVTSFNPEQSGTFSFFYEITDDETGCTNDCFFEIVVNPLPEFDCPTYGPFCEGDENIMFMEDGEFFFDGDLITGWNPSVAGTFEITYVYTDPVTGCSDECMLEIVVNPLPEFDCPSYGPFIVGDEPVTFTEPGQFTYNGDVITGWNPDTEGTFEIVYTETNEFDCSSSCEFTIIVGDVTCDDAVISGFPEALPDGCAMETYLFDFEGVVVQHATSIIWTVTPPNAGTVENEIFTLNDDFTGGIVTISLLAVAAPPCQDATASVSFEIYALPVVTCPDSFEVDLDELPILLSGATPAGGVYTGEGVQPNGDFLVEMTGNFEITYSYTDDVGCENFCTFIITVTGECEDAFINNFPVAPDFVCTGSDFELDFNDIIVEHFTDLVWTVSPEDAGNIESNVFELNPDFPGGMVTIQLVAIAIEPCNDATAELSFDVTPLVVCSEDNFICMNDLPYTLDFGTPPGGIYVDHNGDLVNDNLFDPPAPGVYTFTYIYTQDNPEQKLVEWSFTDLSLDPSHGEGVLDVIGGTAVQNFTGQVLNTNNYPAQQTGNSTAGIAFFTNTQNFYDLKVSFRMQATDRASRWAKFQYTTNNGLSWNDLEHNSGNLTPPSTWRTYTLELPEEVLDNPDFGIRVVSMFSPVAFNDGLGNNYPANSAYHRSRPIGGFAYSPSGTWRFDDIKVTGRLMDEPCASLCTFVVQVNEPPSIVLDPGTAINTCAEEYYDIDFSSTVVTNEFDTYWTIEPSNAGAIVSDVFTLNTDFEQGTVTITLTAVAADGCEDETASVSFEVYPLPIFEDPQLGPYCVDFGVVDFPDQVGGYTATYTQLGIPVDDFNTMDGAGTYTFVLTLETEFGCTTTGEFEIVVVDLPVCPTAYGPFCVDDDPVTFSEPGEFKFEDEVITGWSPDEAGTFTITYTHTNQFGCFISCEFFIVVNPLPVVECPTFEPVCQNSAIIDFPDVPNGVYTNSSGDVVTVFNPTTPGVHEFTLTVTNSFGCENSCDFTITVNPLPVVDCPQYDPVCIDADPIVFGNDGVYTDPFGNVTNTFDPAYWGAGVWTFTYTVIDANEECENSCEFTITVNPLPILSCPADLYVCLNAPAFDLYDETGLPAAGFFEGDGIVDGSFDPEAAGMGDHAITYNYVDENGCENSCDFTITVNIPPLVYAGPDLVGEFGDPLTITGSAAFSPGGTIASLYWSPGADFVDSTLLNPTIQSLEFSETYTLTVIDNNGCSYTDQMTITVIGGPLRVKASAEPREICQGESTQLLANVEGGTPPYTFKWTNLTTSEEFTEQNPVVVLDAAGVPSFFLEVWDALDAYASAFTDVEVRELPDVTCPDYPEQCQGSSEILFDFTPGWTYTDAEGTVVISFNPVVPGTFTFTLTVDDGTCPNSCEFYITVNPTPPCPDNYHACVGDETITFNEDGEFSFEGNPITTWNPESAGTYTLTYTYTDTETGCGVTCEVFIVVHPLPVFECPSYGPLCVGDMEITFDEQGLFTYDGNIITGWNPTMDGTFEIMYTETNEFGCEESCTFDLVVNPLPVIEECPSNLDLCNSNEFYSFADMFPSFEGVFSYEGNVIPGWTPNVSDEFTVTYTETNEFGCSASCDFTISVFDLPILTAGPDLEVEYGDSVTIVAANAFSIYGEITYEWSPAEAFVDHTVLNPTTVPLEFDGIYTFTVTELNGCVNSDEMKITVTGGPLRILAGVDKEVICFGESAQLTALVQGGAEDYTFQWTSDPDGFESNEQNPVVTPEENTIYTIVVVDGDDNSVTASVAITVNPLPEFDCPEYGPFCAGEDAVIFDEPGVFTYNGAVITGWDPIDAGTFTITYTETNEFGCEASCEFGIVVNPVPECPVYGPFCANGDDVTFSEPGTFFFNDLIIEGWNPETSGPGEFLVRYVEENEFGCALDCEFVIVVNPLPLVNAGPNRTVSSGPITITGAMAFGDQLPLHFQWSPADAFVNPNVLNPTTTSQLFSGTYKLTVTDANGCEDSDEMEITVTGGPLLINPVALPEVVCLGDAVQLKSNWQGGIQSVTYIWTDNQGVMYPNAAAITVNPVTNTLYYLEVTDNDFPPTTLRDTLSVTVNPLPEVPTCPVDMTVCSGTEYIQFPPVPGGIYKNADGVTVTGFNPSNYTTTPKADIFTLIVSNEFGCTQECTFTITVNPQPDFDCPEYGPYCVGDGPVIFTQIGTFTQNGVVVTGFDPVEAGTYTFVYTRTNSFGCTTSCNFDIVVNEYPEVTCPDSFEICYDTPPFELMGATPADGVYSGAGVTDGMFNPSVAGVGNHVITYTFGDLCKSHCTFTITVNPLPTITAGPDRTVEYGHSITITQASAFSPNGPLTYHWSPEEFFVDPHVLKPTTVDLFITRTYYFTVTDSKGCSTTDDLVITVLNAPLSVNPTAEPSDICVGESSTLTANAFGGTGTYQYVWSVGGNPIGTTEAIQVTPQETTTYDILVSDGGATPVNGSVTVSVTLFPVVVCPDDVEVCIDADPFEIGGEMFDPAEYGVGVHSFTLTEFNQCGTDECTYYVTVYDLPEVTCPVDIVLEISDLPLQLTGALPEGGIYSGEGVVGSVFHVNEPGDYEITYVYSDENGCEGSCTFIVTVEADPFGCITIDLTAGFQFISSYIIPGNPNMLAVMDDVLNNLDFVRNSEGDQLTEFFGFWLNGIGDWKNKEGYLVRMYADDQLEICGAPIDPQTPIELNAGFQFVGYLADQPQDALDAFDGILDNLEFARNSSGDQLVKFFGQWLNGIGDLNPGEGYLLRMSGAAELVYPPVISKATTNTVKGTLESVHWPVVTGDPSDVIWTLYILDAFMNDIELVEGDEIAIFDGDKLVGSMTLPGTPSGEPHPDYALKAWRTLDDEPGFTPGNSFTLKVWRSQDDLESLSVDYEFLPEGYQGDVFPAQNSISAARITGMTLATNIGDLSGTNEVSVYPNPAKDLLNVVSGKEIRNVSLLNYVGQIVYNQRVNANSAQLSVQFYPAGMYFVRIETTDGIVVTKRVALQ